MLGFLLTILFWIRKFFKKQKKRPTIRGRQNKPIAICGFDTEFTSPSIADNKILALGADLYVLEEDRSVGSYSVSFPPIPDVGGATWEFWNSEENKAAFEKLKSNAISLEEGAEIAMTFYKRAHELYDVYYVSDCPGADVPFHDRLLQEHGQLKTTVPLHFDPGQFRPYYQTDELILHLARKVFGIQDVVLSDAMIKEAWKEALTHRKNAHLPDEDAKVNTRYIANVLKSLTQ